MRLAEKMRLVAQQTPAALVPEEDQLEGVN
jgi:hypothetical protein